jgi:nitroreductase
MTTPTTTVRPLTTPEAAERRRSVRRYEPTPVPEADLREILRLVSLAPSANNIQPWRFVVVRDPALKQQLKAASYGQAQVENAPAVIVMYTDMADMLAHADEVVHPALPVERRDETVARLQASFGAQPEAEREAFGAGQGYIALGYLMLVAQSLGYATVPMLGFEADKVKAILDLPAHVQIPAIVPIGVAAEEGFPTHRHAVDRIVSFR